MTETYNSFEDLFINNVFKYQTFKGKPQDFVKAPIPMKQGSHILQRQKNLSTQCDTKYTQVQKLSKACRKLNKQIERMRDTAARLRFDSDERALILQKIVIKQNILSNTIGKIQLLGRLAYKQPTN